MKHIGNGYFAVNQSGLFLSKQTINSAINMQYKNKKNPSQHLEMVCSDLEALKNLRLTSQANMFAVEQIIPKKGTKLRS